MGKLIVGGGPIGLFLGGEIEDGRIIDQKTTIGRPTRCTGIVTEEIKKFLTEKELRSIKENTITETEIIGPTKKIRIKTPPNYIISNQKFEELLADRALRQGTEILTKHKYLGSTKKGHRIKNLETGREKNIKSEELIGADGPLSEVNKKNKVAKPLDHYIGMQVKAKVREQENKVRFYPHIGNYAWYVPESENTARIGVCTNNKSVFDAFLKKFKHKVLENQSGIIPIHKPGRRTKKQGKDYDIKLVGDAAGHIKNTTGGGIIPGLQGVNNMVDGKSNRKLNRELYTHFLVHNFLKTFSDGDWDGLIKKIDGKTFEGRNRDELRRMIPRLGRDPVVMSLAIKKFLSGKVPLW